MDYLQNDNKYSISYQELKEKYKDISALSNKEFLNNLPRALHLACAICFLKEIPTEHIVGDEGIVHQMVHFIDGTFESSDNYMLDKMRALYNEVLKLV